MGSANDHRHNPGKLLDGVVDWLCSLSILKYQFATFTTELDQAVSQVDRLESQPEAALAQAQFHLRAARRVLQPYRPLANLIIPQAERLPALQPIASWWTFVDEATMAGESLLTAAQIGIRVAGAGQLAGLLDQMPLLEPPLAAAQDHFLRAQTARSGLILAGCRRVWPIAPKPP